MELLPAVPWVLGTVLGGSPFTDFRCQYSSIVIGQLYIATLYAIKRGYLVSLKGLALAILVANVLINPVVHITLQVQASLGSNVYRYEVFSNSHVKSLNEALSLVPENASVYTQGNLLPHLYNRFELYSIYNREPYNFRPKYIVVDTKSSYSRVDWWFPWYSESPVDVVGRAILDGYHLMYFRDGVYVLTLDESPSSIIDKSLTISPQELYGGRLSWTAKGAIMVSERWQWIYGPYISLPPGNYNVTWLFRVIEGGKVVFDVAQAGNPLTFREVELPRSITNFTLTFELKKNTPNLEFRVIPKDLGLFFELERIEVEGHDPPVTSNIETPKGKA